MKTMNDFDKTIIFKRTIFLSSLDEDVFFYWLERIPCIKSIDHVYDEVRLHLKDNLSEYDLMDIIAILYRYKGDLKQMQRFLTKENRSWLYENKHAYWHRRLWGTVKK